MSEHWEVRLTRDHRHNGVRHPAGAQLTLPVRVAAWMIDQGAAEKVAVSPDGARVVIPRARPRGGCCGQR